MLRVRRSATREGASIAIIGAGFSGIAAAVGLHKAGFRNITILERAAGPGGTWWHNRYAGAEVDTPSILYSYSWMPWNWSRTHVRQAELQDYLGAVLERFQLTQRCRFGVTVSDVEWDDGHQEYALYAGDDLILRAKYVVSAVGLLSDPRLSDISGLDVFAGEVFHSTEWGGGRDVSGQRVAVVGSGSTAAQVVPSIAATAKSVVMYQREPGWVVPKRAREYTDEERWALGFPIAQRIARARMIMQRDRVQRGAKVWHVGSPQNLTARKVATNFIASTFGDRPDLLEAVTPSFPYGGKRAIISDDFYPSLLRDNVTLVPFAASRLTPTGVVDALGEEREADVVVLATGFKANFITTYNLRGRGGVDIHQAWDGDEAAFLGIMVPRFPNFFMMYGPNTNGGTIVTNFELQASYARSAIIATERRRAARVEVRPIAADVYDRWIQARLADTAFQYEHNYYRSASGRIATQWPDGALLYGALTKTLRRPCWRIERQVGSKTTLDGGGAEAPVEDT